MDVLVGEDLRIIAIIVTIIGTMITIVMIGAKG